MNCERCGIYCEIDSYFCDYRHLDCNDNSSFAKLENKYHLWFKENNDIKVEWDFYLNKSWIITNFSHLNKINAIEIPYIAPKNITLKKVKQFLIF